MRLFASAAAAAVGFLLTYLVVGFAVRAIVTLLHMSWGHAAMKWVDYFQPFILVFVIIVSLYAARYSWRFVQSRMSATPETRRHTFS